MTKPVIRRQHPVHRSRLAKPALALALVAGLAAAAVEPAAALALAPTFFVAQNTTSGARVTDDATGARHDLGSPLMAVAADGTRHVLRASLTPSRLGAVVVGPDGVGTILDADLTDAGLEFVSANGHVVRRDGDSLALLDPTTGEATALAGVPAPIGHNARAITAIAALADGAVVATVNMTDPGTSGSILSTHLWKLTAGAATELLVLGDARISALAADSDGIDGLLLSNDDDSLSHLHLDGSGSDVTPLAQTLPAGVTAAAIGYEHAGGALAPVLAFTTGSRTLVRNLAGSTLRTVRAGGGTFVSAEDLADVTSVSNPLTTIAALSGVPDGAVRRYGSKIVPVASAVATGIVAPSPVEATLTMTRGGKTKVLRSGKAVPLTANTCFTATAEATVFTSEATPVTQCVSVAHKIALSSFKKHGRHAVLVTTDDRVQVQVKVDDGWRTVRTFHADRHGMVEFKVPAGRTRAVALASDDNAGALLGLTKR